MAPRPLRPFIYFRRFQLILLLFFSQNTPLHHSAMGGSLEVCRLLLQCKADVDAKDAR